ncbi:polyisoprenoid-binding protein YceI [Acinetobacter baylyi]|uniref:Polyisoprenoid-binding protein YceI n=1 Tax=Acinetobacter baylyi TaxID=202950 RepID=A0ABU0V0C7_ACIBI|nr:polyisoprenoid-binding protein YceI [Acinetobacter baylyi]MDR6106189.1 polyisoprenoid-binding protein YceI [Acinetobacter baylyi]MDR6187086.1 polyisoprenoid-binding protein YceI [Acinetobacter baylyi]
MHTDRIKTNMRFVSLFTVMLATASAAETSWILTPDSEVGFHIDSLGVNIVKARFNTVQSWMKFDPAVLQNASVRFVLDVNSLSFDKPAMRNMILGQDLFYAEKYKTVTFKSNNFKALDDYRYVISGQLTIRGVSKPVIFNATLKPVSYRNHLMDVSATTTIDRSDFGMKKAFGGVGEKVNIQLVGQWQNSP